MSAAALFAAIYVPNFILQAIARCEPELRAHPLAILDGPPPTYRVVALNRIAEMLGVTPGMTKAAASQFAQITLRTRCKTREAAAHAALLDAAWSIAPRVEDAAPDTLLLDLSGLASLFGDEQKIAREIVSRVASVGMDAHVAISANVETARIVARALPGPTLVPRGEERRYLETLPVNMLGPSPELREVFGRWGITTCKSLASLPVLALSECAGQEGVHLHAVAGGKGARPLLLAEPPQTFEEWFELDEAVEDLESLSFLLGRLLDQLSQRLCARALSIAAVQVNFELQSAFENAFDTSRDLLRVKPLPVVFTCLLELPVPTRDSKLLLKLLRLRLQSRPPGAPVQKIHMTAQPSIARVTQGLLFVPASPDPDKLELTLARIASVVGDGNVGSPELLDSHQPDAFQMRKFSPLAVAGSRADHPAQNSAAPQIALHAFRPPLPARVQVRENRPVRAFFQGRSGKVVHASGPWRSGGQWWEERPWQEDAWDLEIEFSRDSSGKTPVSALNGFYRFSYDALRQQWSVRGVYD